MGYFPTIHMSFNHVTVFLITGVKQGEACTVVLRGATKMIVDEAERSLHDALCVLTQTVKETRTVFGGGWLIRWLNQIEADN